MVRFKHIRSISAVIGIGMSYALGAIGPAHAAAGDCTRMDAKAVGTVLGVPARVNGSQGHSKLPPDNMDLLSCGYFEVTPAIMGRSLLYLIYTPIPKDIASVYASLSGGNFPRKLVFSPNVGSQSSGWYRSSLTDSTFEGQVAMQSGATITVIKIGGMPSSDAVKNALIAAGKMLAKP